MKTTYQTMAENILSDKSDKKERQEMICDKCHYSSGCEELPDKNGRCSDYLKDGDILISDGIILNPTDSTVYDYDFMKDIIDRDST